MKNTLDIVNRECDITNLFQEKINSLNVGETLKVVKGFYNIRNIFLKSNITLLFEDNVYFNLITKGENFKIINTRVAGINMPFYAAVINIIDSKNVTLIGHVTINGNGSYFWEKYWGRDTKGGMREVYDKEGIRFLCDYDCMRTRNVLIQNSTNILLDGLTSKDSGFWNIHVLYSHDIKLNNITVDSYNLFAPSTDGIDIDSSYNVSVSNSTLSTNDDSIAIKSGRDSDGLKTNIPSHDIIIKDCTILKGFGITLGSELSGGIYNVDISNIKYKETDCAFRIKSSQKRKGYIKNIKLNDLDLYNVSYPIHIDLNWNKSYNDTIIPPTYKGEIKEYYKVICKDVDSNIKNTIIKNIEISNLNSKIDSNVKLSRAFEINGFFDSPIINFKITNCSIKALEYGRISYVKGLLFNNTTIDIMSENKNSSDSYDNR